MHEILWRTKLNSSIYSGPVSFDNILFCGVWDCYLYAIDNITGKEIWKFKTDSNEVKNIYAQDGIVFCSNGGENLYAIDIKTGFQLWHFEANSRISTTPSIDNNIVFIGSEFGDIYGLDILTGKMIWKKSVKAEVTSLIVHNDILFFKTEGEIKNETLHGGKGFPGYLVIFDVKLNDVLHEIQIDHYNVNFILNSYSVYFGTRNSFCAYNTINKEFTWEFKVLNGEFGKPIIERNLILLGNENSIMAIDKSTGIKSDIFTFESDEFQDSPSFPLFFDKTLFYITSGLIYQIDLLKKEIINEFKSNFTNHIRISQTSNHLFYAENDELICVKIT